MEIEEGGPREKVKINKATVAKYNKEDSKINAQMAIINKQHENMMKEELKRKKQNKFFVLVNMIVPPPETLEI